MIIPTQPFIFMDHDAGFGNTIFDLILAYSLHQKYKKDIYYVEYYQQKHENHKMESLQDLFPELAKRIHFITQDESNLLKMNYPIVQIRKKQIQHINKIQYLLQKKPIQLFPYQYYSSVYSLFFSFSKDEQQYFLWDTSSQEEKYKDLLQEDFVGVHIRYGDKLYYGIQEKKKKTKKKHGFMSFPIYTPEYYHEQIMNILKKKKDQKIYIFTDSPLIVQKFIYERYHYESFPNIQIMNTSYLDTFFLLLYSRYFIMSHSTFSYAIFLLKRNPQQECIFCTMHQLKEKYNSADCFFHPSWNFIFNKNYILNLQQPKIRLLHQFLSNPSIFISQK